MNAAEWFVAIWLCVALPDGAEDCGLVIADGRFDSRLICRQALAFVVPAEVARVESAGWDVSRVRNTECRGPTNAV